MGLPPPRLPARAGLAAAPFILLLLAATPALAHTSERAFILLLPTGYYLVGGTLAVAASFLILLALPSDRIKRCFDARVDLMQLPTMLQALLSAISFALLVLLVAIGFLGSRDPLDNPLPLAVWTIWWIGVTLAHAVFGNLWRWINPWIAPYRFIRRLLGWQGAPLPYRLGYWPAVVSFLAFAWFELIHPAPDDPAVLALAVIVYSAVTWIGMALFGEETWLARGEAFSAFFGLIARMAPFQPERASQPSRRVYLVVPGRSLAGSEPLPPSGILFVLLTLTTVSFDGLSRTFWWLGLNGINPLEFPGRSAVVGINSVGLLALFVALATAFLACIDGRPRPVGSAGPILADRRRAGGVDPADLDRLPVRALPDRVPGQRPVSGHRRHRPARARLVRRGGADAWRHHLVPVQPGGRQRDLEPAGAPGNGPPGGACRPGAAGCPDGGLHPVRALAAVGAGCRLSFEILRDLVCIRTIKNKRRRLRRAGQDPRNWGRFR